MPPSLPKDSNGYVKVPAWVMAVTYFMCWGFATALIVAMVNGHVENKGLIIGTVIYLITWPVFQQSPAELLRRL